MADAITYIGTIVAEQCYLCGVRFGMPQDFKQQRLQDHRNFFCPNGHSQHYIGKTEAEQLRDKLAAARSREDQLAARAVALAEAAEHERRRAMGFKGALTKVKKRVGRGVCPCCNRTFANLHDHMTTQHPAWSPDGDGTDG